MKQFMDKDFLLSGTVSKKLYHDYAEKMPILDYHCHLSPKEIAADKIFQNITELWLSGDHYKWRIMRSNGVEEFLITGDAPDKEKFKAFAAALPRAIGNPMYHWCHLELRRYFDYDGILNEETWETVWDICNNKLKSPSMSAKNLIRMSNVTIVCTTDDPIDDLHYHEDIKNDKEFDVQVLPAWRPDLAMSPEKEGFVRYIHQLEEVSEIKIHCFNDWKKALIKRLDYFVSHGCVLTDHGLDYSEFEAVSADEIEEIFQKSMMQRELNLHELRAFRTMGMLFLGKEYAERNLAMQLHYGAKRENNSQVYKDAGANAGIDCINEKGFSSQITDFLNALHRTGKLPKTILYSLNPVDNALIGTIIGCFQGDGIPGKIQQGSAWWFNDHKSGITEQITSLANLGLLGNFIGMLTDSRSFISYPRHEYFRRILCEFIGTLVENGEYPEDYKALGGFVQDISYHNAWHYFGFRENKM
ncbi:MAG: glucuronate isomerase [Lachnoclostridium sp.]|nr:glucuronate isomerase [Lachnoclostridium sp.]